MFIKLFKTIPLIGIFVFFSPCEKGRAFIYENYLLRAVSYGERVSNICAENAREVAGKYGLDAAPFLQFLSDDTVLYVVPSQFGQSDTDILNPSRELIEQDKRLASVFKEFINSLSTHDRNAIFQKKFEVVGVDRYLSEMAGGGRVPFAENGGQVISIEDCSNTIDFRAFDRTLRIPHFMYKISIIFPQKQHTYTFFIKALPQNDRHDDIYQRLAGLFGIRARFNKIGYFKRDDVSNWQICGEIPYAVKLENVPADIPMRKDDWLVEQTARCAALNHALLAGNTQQLFTDEEEPFFASIDYEFMLLERNMGVNVADAQKGQGEVFSLRRVPSFQTWQQRVGFLERFEQAYFDASARIYDRRQEVRGYILKWPNGLAMADAFDRALEENPAYRLQQIFNSLLDWSVKEIYLDQWGIIWDAMNKEMARSTLAQCASSSNDVFAFHSAASILANEHYDEIRKIKELSMDPKTLDEAFGIIRRLTSEVFGAQALDEFDARASAARADNQRCLKLFNSRREFSLQLKISKAGSIQDIIAIVKTMPVPLSSRNLEIFIDRMEFISHRLNGELNVGRFIDNVMITINASSPPFRRQLWQSQRLTRLIFGVEAAPASSINFDHNILVLGHPLIRLLVEMQKAAPDGVERYKGLQRQARENWTRIIQNRTEPLNIAVVVPAYIGEKQRIEIQKAISIKLNELKQLLNEDPKGLVAFTLYVVDDKPPRGLVQVVAKQAKDVGIEIDAETGRLKCRYLRLQDAINAGKVTFLYSSERQHNIKWGSIRYGMETAITDGAHIVVMTDTDSSQRLTEIPNLIAPILLQGYAVVNGSRFMAGAATNVTTTHNYGEFFLYGPLARMCIPEIGDVEDVLSGFKAFTAGILRDALPYMKTYDFSTDLEMLLLIAQNGGRIVEVPRSALDLDLELTAVDSAGHMRRIVEKMMEQMSHHRQGVVIPREARGLISALESITDADIEKWRNQQTELATTISGIQSGQLSIQRAREAVAAIMGNAVLIPESLTEIREPSSSKEIMKNI